METISQTRAQPRAQKSGGRAWLLGVIGVYSTFALGTLGVVGFTFTQKIELVGKRHYEEGVAFQSRIDDAKRTEALTEPLSWKLSADRKYLEISYPASLLSAGTLSGTITFMRPSSSALDTSFPVAVDTDGKQRIPLSSLQSGFWTISLEMDAAGRGYLKEATLNL